MTMNARAKTGLVVFVFVLIAGYSPAAGLWVRSEAAKRTGFSVRGRYVPVPVLPRFILRQATGEWKGKVRILAGDLEVKYDLLRILTGRPLRLRIVSRNLSLEFLAAWAGGEDLKTVRASRFEADLEIGKKGLTRINLLRVESPTFQFHIQHSEN